MHGRVGALSRQGGVKVHPERGQSNPDRVRSERNTLRLVISGAVRLTRDSAQHPGMKSNSPG
jgi:hypothetical protein